MNKKVNENAVQRTKKRYQTIEYAEQYKKDYTSDYSFKGFRSRVIAYKEVKIVKYFFNKIVKNNMKILDLPCGTGKLGTIFSSHPVHVTAGDISESMLRLAKNEYNNEKVDFKVIDALNIPYNDDYFDIIICLRLFQRIPSDTRLQILSEFRRTGKNNLIVSYSFISIWQKIRFKLKKMLVKDFNFFYSDKLKQIELELEQSGFQVLSKKIVLSFLSSEIIFLSRIRK